MLLSSDWLGSSEGDRIEQIAEISKSVQISHLLQGDSQTEARHGVDDEEKQMHDSGHWRWG